MERNISLTQQVIHSEILKQRNSIMACIFAIVRDYHLAEDVFQDTG